MHAELVPVEHLQKPPCSVFYLPMHAVRKDSSTTTKIRAVFDASAQTSTGVSLNDTLLVGPTVHSSLIDVLLVFNFIALHSLLMLVTCTEQSLSLMLIVIFIVLFGETLPRPFSRTIV